MRTGFHIYLIKLVRECQYRVHKTIVSSHDFVTTGMDDLSLQKFLSSTPAVVPIIFPREAERRIIGIEMKNLVMYDGLEECEDNERVANFFIKYIDELESRTESMNNSFFYW